MTSLTSGRFQPPLSLTEGNTVDFVFRLSNNGTLFTPALTPVWIFGIKDADTPNGDFLIQVNSATSASGVFTFVVELASAELQTWLATATSQSYAAIQITDSANDIATAPLLCQIAPNQNDTGTTPTSANGTLVVAATKTVTFPQSLTFPSALGTNGFQLSTDGAGALTWTAAGGVTDGDKGDITVSNSGATFTIDNDVVGLAQLAHMPTARVIGRTTSGNGSPELLTISGTGSVAMTNTPTLVTPVLGAATATSINGIPISGDATATGIYMNTTAGGIDTSNSGGDITTNLNGGIIDTQNSGGNITTSNGGGTISTSGTGSIELGVTGTRTTFRGNAATVNKTIDLPNLTGTVVVTAATSATATQALFAQATGFPAYRAIATADIATALTTPGAIGGTTASTGAFTTLTLGVAGPTGGVAGTVVLKNATNAFTTTIVPSVVTANRQLNLPLITATDTVAVLGLAQTFSGNKTFSGTVSCGSTLDVTGATTCSSTLAVTSTTTLTGLLTANGGITVVGGSNLLTTNSALTDHSYSTSLTLGSNGPNINTSTTSAPSKWIAINDNGTTRYIPTWHDEPP